ncbi:MAG TPA: CpsD/CapB family tyrosine-protein kinase [Bryobacterales bacterium]|nr:CpsD/CapB family tyrosine-protein kinase [Bryobacterales bacterium]
MESIFGNLTPLPDPPTDLGPGLHGLHSAPARGDHSSPYRTVSLQIKSRLPLLRFGDDHWRSAEQYRIIRTKLTQHPRQPKLIGISSAAPGDGKTVNAANIAAAISLKQQAKVLLADADFRRANLAWALGVRSGPGLAEVLAGDCSVGTAIVRLENLPNLHFLPAGENRNAPAELLDSPAWREVCQRVRQDFQFVIFDAPPIGLVADYDLLQAALDGIVLIVRPGHTNRTQLSTALQTVSPDKLLGVVVNCVQESLFWKRHDYYYY